MAPERPHDGERLLHLRLGHESPLIASKQRTIAATALESDVSGNENGSTTRVIVAPHPVRSPELLGVELAARSRLRQEERGRRPLGAVGASSRDEGFVTCRVATSSSPSLRSSSRAPE